MHLVFYIRGVPQHVALWKAMAQNQFFKWRRRNLSYKWKKGDKEDADIEILLSQGGLRDSVLGTMEFTFPKEALPTVLCIMNLKYGDYQVTPSFMSSARVKGLRVLLGVKKIPKKYYDEAEKLDASIMFDNLERGLSDLLAAKVAIHLIGYKEDVMGEFVDPLQKKTYLQEML